MDRALLKAMFNSEGPVVLPVIHVADAVRTLQNIETMRKEGVTGCFLINHDFDIETFLPIIREVRREHPDLWLGINFLAVTGLHAFPILADLANQEVTVDAYWADDARIEETQKTQEEAEAIASTRKTCGWDGFYFGGTAFKKQRPVAARDYAAAAKIACRYMDVVTTSGVATGKEADLSKIKDFRLAIGDQALALASGITPENAHRYADVDCFMVATGINQTNNFYDMDSARLKALLEVCRDIAGGK